MPQSSQLNNSRHQCTNTQWKPKFIHNISGFMLACSLSHTYTHTKTHTSDCILCICICIGQLDLCFCSCCCILKSHSWALAPPLPLILYSLHFYQYCVHYTKALEPQFWGNLVFKNVNNIYTKTYNGSHIFHSQSHFMHDKACRSFK